MDRTLKIVQKTSEEDMVVYRKIVLKLLDDLLVEMKIKSNRCTYKNATIPYADEFFGVKL